MQQTLTQASYAPPNKALQRTRLSADCFPWRSVRAAELGRYVSEAMSKLRCLVSLSLAFGMAHNAIAADSEQMRSWAESYYGEYRSGTVPSFRPDSGYVPNEQTAIDIAKSIWKRIYGEEHTEGRSPYRAFLIDGYWIVLGSLPEGYDKGGVPHAILSKRTGEVVHVIHTK